MAVTLTALPHALIGALFTAAAYVQLNDPDPLLWVSAYVAAAAVAIARAAEVGAGAPPSRALRIAAGAAAVQPIVLLLLSGRMILLQIRKSSAPVEIVPSILPSLVHGAARLAPALEEVRESGMAIVLLYLRRAIEVEEVRESAGMAIVLLYLAQLIYTAGSSTMERGKAGGTAASSRFALVFAGALSLAWAAWVLALRAGAVDVGEHCKGILKG
jgi:hypothetical protein